MTMPKWIESIKAVRHEHPEACGELDLVKALEIAWEALSNGNGELHSPEGDCDLCKALRRIAALGGGESETTIEEMRK